MRQKLLLRHGPRVVVAPLPRREAPRPVGPRRWLISVPAWGDEFVGRLAETLPRLRAAAAQLGEPSVLIVHTDQPDRLPSTEQLPVAIKAVPPGRQWFHRMSAAHADVLRQAKPGDIVVLLTADMVISENALIACKAIFATGRKIVCCNATRANIEAGPSPAGARDLSEWGWRNRHRITRSCTWPNGEVEDLCRVYFEDGPTAVCRLWLAHPLALAIDGRLLPFGPTIDCNLVCSFRPAEIHLVTSPDELAVVELSPRMKITGSRDADEPPARLDLGPMSLRYGRQRRLDTDVYRSMLSQRIIVAGPDRDCGDEIVRAIL